MGALLLAHLAVYEVVLEGDVIELRVLGQGRVKLHREDIRGRRTDPADGRTLIFERKGGGKPIKHRPSFEPDATFRAWLEALPDLDREDREAVEAALLASAALGATAEQRAQTLNVLRRVARVLTIATFAVGAWCVFHPSPYHVVVALLAAVPLVGVGAVVVGRGAYSVTGARNDPRPRIDGPLILPGLLLGVRATLDLAVVDLAPLALTGSAVGLVLAALSTRYEPARSRAKAFASLFLALGLFGAFVGAEANALLDFRPAELLTVEVRGERVTNGRHRSTYLRLAPWGPFGAERDYRVPTELHDALTVGDTVCIELHPGALGARWYTIDVCE